MIKTSQPHYKFILYPDKNFYIMFHIIFFFIADRILLAETVDYEEAKQYLLTVLATDTGVHPLNTHTTINISVSDSNDNAPQFSQPSYSADVSELAAPGDKVIQVRHDLLVLVV